MCGKCAIDNTQYFSHDARIAGKQKSKLKREAQYPLPNGLMGQHIINQQGGAFCHSPRTTAGSGRPRLKPSAWWRAGCTNAAGAWMLRSGQLNATRCSWWQSSQRTRKKPYSKRPHLRYASNSDRTYLAVDKNKINNNTFVRHTLKQDSNDFAFSSAWNYSGHGEKQSLKLSIEKTTQDVSQSWQDEHPMVAFGFEQLIALLKPYFEVHVFEHDYNKIVPWDRQSGNAIFVCVKI